MNPIAITIGNFSIYWYSILIVIGSILGALLVFKEVKKHNISEDDLINILLGILICAIVGARLYYVLFNLDYFIKFPIEIFDIRGGGLAIHGGIIACVIWIAYYTKKKKINTYKMLDILSVGLLVGQIFGRWGNFFNSEAYGAVTNLTNLKSLHIPNFIIDGMLINGNYHHPTFFYESLWCIIGLIIILIVRNKLKDKLKLTNITSIYLIWYSIGRFLIESLRTDSLMLGPIRIAQLVSVAMIIIGIVLMALSKTKEKYYLEKRSKK